MSLLPALRLGADRWWLPLAPESTELLGHVILAGRSGQPLATSGLRPLLVARLQADPPLLIYAALAATLDPVRLPDLADWLIRHATDRFASGDAFIGAPAASPDRLRRWRELRDHFATLPLTDWIPAAGLWLEAGGPAVPQPWQEQWPRLVRDEDDDTKNALHSPPLLTELARLVQHAGALESSFATALKTSKLAAVEQLAYGLSHEINNPLTNISTRAQQLQRDEADAERVAILQRIVDQVYRAHQMIADLMFYANPPAVSKQPFDLTELVREVAGDFRREAERQSIRLEADRIDGVQKVVADRNMLGEAVRVLLRNAIEAVGSQGTIVVRVEPGDAGPRVTIADSGPGLSEKARKHAFDPYYSGREAGRGLGLGLCRAYRIAQLHSGDLTLTSGPAGCVATLSMPSEKPAAES